MQSYLIGIAGPSCSGKSEIARRLSRILRAPILALDHYYRDLKHMPMRERIGVNFDAPDSLDHELIAAHARALRQGHPVEQPDYDFAHHIRSASTHPVVASEFVILEGLFALYWSDVRQLLDEKIYVTASHDICVQRRIYRDVRERGRTEESVRAQYEATVRPMCEQFVAPTEAFAEVVLPGSAAIKHSVYQILNHLARRLKDSTRQQVFDHSISTWVTTPPDDQAIEHPFL